MEVLKQAAGQLLALFTFFAFPAIQYVLLKTTSRRKGQPELWYLPDFGFRLVIRNLPYNKTLTDIQYRTLIRRTIPSSAGSSVQTLDDRSLGSREDMVLIPGTDQILLSFKLDKEPRPGSADILLFRLTDKLGVVEETMEVQYSDRLICDYTATIQNFFNFDIRMGKRVEIYGGSLSLIFDEAQRSGDEQKFSVDRIRNIQ